MEGMGIMIIFLVLLFFAIGVAIARWIFRVNDIVQRQDDIIKKLGNIATLIEFNPRKEPFKKEAAPFKEENDPYEILDAEKGISLRNKRGNI